MLRRPKQDLSYEIKAIARLDSIDVFFTGEPGTGKTHCAKQIHEMSPRARKPFIAVNCAELSPTLIEAELFGAEKGSFTGAVATRVGKFEAAMGGTLFLDEIGELPFDMQAKLLKAVEEKRIMRVGGNAERKVDVRLIFATNQPLERFREDFKQRLLCAYQIKLQSLSERQAEIPALITMFLQDMNSEMRRQFVCQPDVFRQLQERRWSGNIRELRGTIRRLCVKALIAAPAEDTMIEIKLEDEQFEFDQPVAQISFTDSHITSITTDTENASTEPTIDSSEGLFYLRQRENELFVREYQALRAKGLNCQQVADAMGLKRRTFFNRLKRSREIVAVRSEQIRLVNESNDNRNNFDKSALVSRSQESSTGRVAA